MSSLYKEYLTEVTNRHIIEESYGFITYEIIDNICYIADFFVLKEWRGRGWGYELFNKVREAALSAKCLTIMGRVEVSSRTCNESLQLYLKYGAKLLKTDNGVIFLTKEL